MENRKLQQQLAQKDTVICQLQQENSQLREQIQNNQMQMEEQHKQKAIQQNTAFQTDKESNCNKMLKELIDTLSRFTEDLLQSD